MAQRHARILVVNPNSSASITETFKPIIAELDLPNTTITYWTNTHGPSMIKNESELYESASQCLPLLLGLAHHFDGFLAACYADHPLVHLLRDAVHGKPVVSIFEASILACVQLCGMHSTFGIVTTAAAYESLLNQSVASMLESGPTLSGFAGTCATGISLQDLQPAREVLAGVKVIEATTRLIKLSGGTLGAVSMGGVILAGKEKWVRKACEREFGVAAGSKVMIVDQLLAGMLTLDNEIRERSPQDINFRQALR